MVSDVIETIKPSQSKLIRFHEDKDSPNVMHFLF